MLMYKSRASNICIKSKMLNSKRKVKIHKGKRMYKEEPDKIAKKHLSEELRDQQVIWKGQYIRIHNKIYIHLKKESKSQVSKR